MLFIAFYNFYDSFLFTILVFLDYDLNFNYLFIVYYAFCFGKTWKNRFRQKDAEGQVEEKKKKLQNQESKM